VRKKFPCVVPRLFSRAEPWRWYYGGSLRGEVPEREIDLSRNDWGIND
jgi:hypothetical protein